MANTPTNINEIAIEIAPLIADEVSSEMHVTVALIGAISALGGVLLGIFGNAFVEWCRAKSKRNLDKQRKDLLETLLKDKNHEWRKLKTLSRVIGAYEDETKRLLIEIKARGSERDDDLWPLISDKPLANKGEFSE
ncbi:MAG: hypothetical protein ACLFP8_07435 [Alphaproteobacteria bacterium]